MLEELGVRLRIGRALVMQWVWREDDPDGVLHLAYDGGSLDDGTIASFSLPPEELASFRFVEPSAVSLLASADTAARVAACLDALATGTFIELDH